MNKAEFKSFVEKNKIIIILVPIAIALFVYTTVSKEKEKESSQFASAYEMPNYEKQEQEPSKIEQYKSKIAKERREKGYLENREDVLDDFYNLEEKKEAAAKDTSKNQGEKTESTINISEKLDYRSKYEDPEKKRAYPSPKPKKKEEAPEEPKPTSRYYIPVEGESNNNAGEGEKVVNANYVSAFLERDTKLTDGKKVVFLLDEDCKINGVEIKKMSLVFCYATCDGNRFNIKAYSIEGPDNNIYDVNLLAYTKDYQEGIPVDDRYKKAAKDGGNEYVDDALSTIPHSSTAKAIRRSVQRLDKRDIELSLPEGYIMKFKLN